MNVLKSLTNCKVLSTITMEQDKKEWLATRSLGIGGSDVGTICGVNTWSSPRMLYLTKTGQYDEPYEVDKASNERMHFGNLLEPVVADEYCKRTGNKIAVSPATLQHKEYPWALANLDRFIIDDEGKPYGVLECKTAGEFMDDMWDDGDVPIQYLYQLNWYLWITGLEYGAIACLVGGNKFYHYEVIRNDSLIADELLPKAKNFWENHVLALVEPPISGTDTDTELVTDAYPESKKNAEIVLPDDEDNDLANTIVDCKKKIKELEGIMKEAMNRIKEKMKDNEIAYTQDHVIKWSTVNQSRIDNDTLRANFPEIASQVTVKSSYRRMTIK